MKHPLFYALLASLFAHIAWAQDNAPEGGKPAPASDVTAALNEEEEEGEEAPPAEKAAEPAKEKAAESKEKASKPATTPAKKEAKPEPKVESKTEPKAEPKADAKPETKAPADAASKKDYVVMRINGDEIKNSELEEAFKIMVPGGDAIAEQALGNETIRQSVLREIISKKLVYKEALKEGLDKNDMFEKRLELARRQLLIQAYVEKHTSGLVTDAALKKAYDEKVKKLSGIEEVKARHILVSKKEDADQILKELKAGGDFAKIAREKSEDKASGAGGGELGWFTQDKMVPEFGKAAFALKKNEFSAPVRTEFGYHIIQLQDRRKLPVPPFEDMQRDLEEEVINHELDKTLAGLVEKADIEYYGPDGKPKKFERQRRKDAK